MPSAAIAVTGQALLHGALDLTGAGALRRLLRESDAAFANLEATVETQGAWPTKTKTLHLAEAAALGSLADLGFAGLTHANNHAFDLGPPGVLRTRAAAADAGLQLAGSGRDEGEALAAMLLGRGGARVAVLSIDLGPQPEIVYAGPDRAGISPLRLRRQVTVPEADFAVLRRLSQQLGDERRTAAREAVGYQASAASDGSIEFFGTAVRPGPGAASSFIPDAADFLALQQRLAQAREAADLVAVALHNHHWDGDWTTTPDWMLALCRELIDAGADLVAGTGAPVLQPVAFHRGKPILAGLGNLIFHTRRAGTYDREGVPVWTGVAARCRFNLAERRCTGVELMPLAVGRPSDAPLAPAPRPLDGEEAERVFGFLTRNLDEAERTLVSRASAA